MLLINLLIQFSVQKVYSLCVVDVNYLTGLLFIFSKEGLCYCDYIDWSMGNCRGTFKINWLECVCVCVCVSTMSYVYCFTMCCSQVVYCYASVDHFWDPPQRTQFHIHHLITFSQKYDDGNNFIIIMSNFHFFNISILP